jgi:hypothetical protein
MDAGKYPILTKAQYESAAIKEVTDVICYPGEIECRAQFL